MQRYTRDELAAKLVRAGELLVSGDDPVELADHFNVEKFEFNGPGGWKSDFAGLASYFTSVREAFDDRTIRRGIVLVEDDLLACQTWIEGTFVRPFTQSPVGVAAPNGRKVVMDLINIFRFDDQGRLVEEHVRVDNRELVEQLS